jgi:hypothetical protein
MMDVRMCDGRIIKVPCCLSNFTYIQDHLDGTASYLGGVFVNMIHTSEEIFTEHMRIRSESAGPAPIIDKNRHNVVSTQKRHCSKYNTMRSHVEIKP